MKSPGQNNFSDRRGNRALVSRPIVFALIVVIVLLFIQLLFPRIFTSTFSYFFSSLWSGKNSIVYNMTPRAQLLQENQNLEQQLALDQAEASSSKAMIDQDNELKSLLGRPEVVKNLILANVLRRPPGAGYDYFIVDVGSSDGVSVGNPVYSAGLIAVGQIVEADSHSSKVELYSSPGTNYDVLIGASHIPAVATGQGGGFFSVSLSQESGVSIGDEVIIPAISSLPLGFVNAVISDAAQPFERILFSNGINPYQSIFMLVGINALSTKPFASSALIASTTSTTLFTPVISPSIAPKKR
jgi:cell shape-determining protein MreC